MKYSNKRKYRDVERVVEIPTKKKKVKKPKTIKDKIINFFKGF